jgi:hypothetical protein
MKRLNVLPAEDYRVVRKGFWMLLKAEADLDLDAPAAKVPSGPVIVLFHPCSHEDVLE